MKNFNSILFLAAFVISGFMNPAVIQASVSPVLECVEDNGDGTYTAYFGYSNSSNHTINISVGPHNFFTPGQDMGQPEVFHPGRHVNVFSFVFSGNNYVWTLTSPGGSTRTATASKNSPRCVTPTATISGDALLCRSSQQTTVTIDFTGTQPFHFQYKDGSGKIYEINNYEEDSYSFQTNLLTTFEMVSIADAYKEGIVQGSATIALAPKASAVLQSENIVKCPSESVELGIQLSGTSPYSFTLVRQYSDNGNIVEDEIVIEGVGETPYVYETNLQGLYYIRNMSDANCKGSVNPSITATIDNFSTPTAVLGGGGNFCSGEPINLSLNLTGEAPWSIHYQNPDGESKIINNIEETETSFEVTAPGNYQLLSVSDANCEGSVSGEANVVIKDKPTATINGGGDICGSVGGVPVNFNFTGNAPFDIVYTDGNDNIEIQDITENSLQLEVSEIGTYTLISVNDEFCSGTVSGEALVERNALPELIFNMDEKVFCTNAPAIELTATPAGGSFSGPGINNNQFNPSIAGAGTHTITYSFTSEAGCSNTTENEVQVNALPTAQISGGGDICATSEPAEISIALTGAAPFSLTYSDGTTETTVQDINSSSYSFTTSDEGTFTLVSVSDANNCDGQVSGEASVNIISDQIFLDILNEGTNCEGEDIILQADHDGDMVSWTTTGAGTINDVNADEITYTPAEGESGSITFSATASNICTSTTMEKVITIQPLPDAEFSTSPDDKFIYVDNEFLPNTTDADSYSWDFGDGESSMEKSPVYAYEQTGSYEVTLTVEKDGCEASATTTVEIGEQRVVYVPNIFNPAAINPENQVVKVYGEGIAPSDFLFKIVNRWGGTLFETSSLNLAQTRGWDGTASNGEMQALGTYTYIVQGKFLDGETFEKIGTVTLAK